MSLLVVLARWPMNIWPKKLGCSDQDWNYACLLLSPSQHHNQLLGKLPQVQLKMGKLRVAAEIKLPLS